MALLQYIFLITTVYKNPYGIHFMVNLVKIGKVIAS